MNITKEQLDRITQALIVAMYANTEIAKVKDAFAAVAEIHLQGD